MSSEVLHAILIAVVYLVLLGGGEVLFRLRSSRSDAGIRPEMMRKLIHSASGLMSLAFPFLLASHWTLLALISGFVILLVLGQKFNFTTAINATKRESIGDILFPISVYLLFYLSFHDGGRALSPIYVSSILILSISDSTAALVGTHWGKHRYQIGSQHKSWEGSIAFAATAFGIISAVLFQSETFTHALLASIIITTVLTLLEALSLRGTDNITVPIAAFFMIAAAAGSRQFDSIAFAALAAIAIVAVASSHVKERRSAQALTLERPLN